jgi:hypothetical protein
MYVNGWTNQPAPPAGQENIFTKSYMIGSEMLLAGVYFY